MPGRARELLITLLSASDPLPIFLHCWLWRLRSKTWLALFHRRLGEGCTPQAAIYDVLLLTNRINVLNGGAPVDLIPTVARILAGLKDPEQFTIPLYVAAVVERDVSLYRDSARLRAWVALANEGVATPDVS